MSATKQKTKDYQVIGTRPPRVDAGAKVTGAALYGPDIALPGLVHGKILRSPHAHARILRIDTSRAEALPGVLAVVTAKDLPEAPDRTDRAGEGTVNYKFMRDNTFASDKVLYHGHPIAAVAALTPHLAEDALALIDVDYKVLEPVLDVRQAMRDDAPILHDALRTQSLAGPGDRPSNIARHIQVLKGDPEQGFAQADVAVERVFETATVHQGYLEPHASTAHWAPTGHLTIYTTTQGAFDVRTQVHQLLHHPMADIRVIPTEVGGAFGGKNVTYVDVAAALLSRAAGRPVRIVMSQREVLLASGPSSGTWIRVKIGARADGHILAAEAELCYEAGAYPGSPVGSGVGLIFACYDIPHARIDGYDVLVNRPRISSYRAPGATPASFAGESMIDELAAALGMDPLALRLLNCAENGTERVTGGVHRDIALRQMLETLGDLPHYQAALPHAQGPLRYGRGIATAFWGNWGARSSVTLSVNEDGSLSLIMGSVDITGTRTSVAMQAAEALGLPLSCLVPATGDTQSTGHSDTSGGSRTTMATGVAAIEAAKDVLAQMKGRAALVWECPPNEVDYGAGTFTNRGSGETLSFAELAGMLEQTGGAVRGKGDVNVDKWGPAHSAHIADVEVDIETGRVRLLRYTALQEVGKAIHPSEVEGQMQGGATQGIGWALYEGYAYSPQGQMLNANYSDYKMPTALDIPAIETVILEHPSPDHPYGVRGVGEAPIIPPPGAIANAIYDAIGARPNKLPMMPAHILEILGVL